MKYLKGIAFALVVIGALNWGLWGFFQFDLVAWICDGNTSGCARFIYSLVGLAGVWMLCKMCKCRCKSGCGCGCCSTKGKGKM
jgi:uncharacterized membrane protein YuzA (DUF378 family)